MGDIADYYMDLAMEQDTKIESNRHIEQEKLDKMSIDYAYGVLKWNTQFDGKVLVTKMTKEHLENTIAFIKRTMKSGEISEKWIELLGYELEKRK
jgi:hypothetical protein